jgi:hypothetical protein
MTMRSTTAAAVETDANQGADWELTAERGPGWLFVRLAAGGSAAVPSADLSRSIWDMISEHHAHRVVLEFQGVDGLDDSLLETIGDIGSRMRDSGGLVRVCGLSNSALPRHSDGLAAGVPCFRSRTEAVGSSACPEAPCD